MTFVRIVALAIYASATVRAITKLRPFSIQNTLSNVAACANEPLVISCENTTSIQDTCCSPTPGGLILQAQFWDTYTDLEYDGQLLPKSSWTIHGLWPDNCDGSFDQYCDLSRQYDPKPPRTLPDGTQVPPYNGPGMSDFIREFGRFDLLDYMTKYWVSQGSPNDALWAHEFSKHATCTSTFDVACYGPDYQPHQDVVDYFDAVVRAFKQFATYDILASAGIVPSNTTAYQLGDIQNALKARTGGIPYVGCGNDGTVLQEVWYFNHVCGPVQFGRFKPLDSVTKSSCSSTDGIYYYERTPTSERDVRSLL